MAPTKRTAERKRRLRVNVAQVSAVRDTPDMEVGGLRAFVAENSASTFSEVERIATRSGCHVLIEENGNDCTWVEVTDQPDAAREHDAASTGRPPTPQIMRPSLPRAVSSQNYLVRTRSMACERIKFMCQLRDASVRARHCLRKMYPGHESVVVVTKKMSHQDSTRAHQRLSRHEQAAAAAEPSGVDWSAPLSPSAHPSPNLCDETPARTPRLRRGAGTSSNKPGYYPPKTRAAPSPACSASNRKAHSADDNSSFSRPSDARRLNGEGFYTYVRSSSYCVSRIHYVIPAEERSHLDGCMPGISACSEARGGAHDLKTEAATGRVQRVLAAPRAPVSMGQEVFRCVNSSSLELLRRLLPPYLSKACESLSVEDVIGYVRDVHRAMSTCLTGELRNKRGNPCCRVIDVALKSRQVVGYTVLG
ncbi:hypothetical protein HPB51_006994 [Rhipicephalus microplus]|uniref:Uncharacterized protein n=1 Tax=Rhipicephalus microplus TaxID=6941 RepID=A0A9J6EG35_RHIMP|nr:hypothetical protein HPB51_006994 [Rhipicephalus microplus]